MTVEYKSHLTHRGRTFDATWEGGPYIEVRFAGYHQPTEVINVWDYEHDHPEIPFSQWELKLALKRWVLEMDAEAKEWANDNGTIIDDWYAGYVENAGYSQ